MASSDYKKRDREVKGYVEVLYDVKDLDENDYVYCYYYNTGGRTSQLTPFQYGKEFSEIISSSQRVINDYSILYNNYSKLDGSFMLFNKDDNNCGFISNEVPNDLSTLDERNIIFEASLSSGISGLTFYFKNNTIKNANVYLYKNNSATPDIVEIINNDDETLFIDASSDNYTHMIVETTEWSNGNLPVWIKKIDLGLSHVYLGSELIEFEITEQIDKLVEEAPSNELKLTIGDYKNLYDPLNPKGITRFLTEGSLFVPHIGIVLEDGSVDYEKMGVFYFETIDYNSKEVTMTCYNLLNKMSKEMVKNTNCSLIDTTHILIPSEFKSRIETFLFNCYNYQSEINIDVLYNFGLSHLPYESLVEFLQQLTMLDGIFYADRNNKIIIKNIDKTIKDIITKNELVNDIKYINVDNSKSYCLKITQNSLEQVEATDDTPDFSVTLTLKKQEEEICLVSSDANSFHGYTPSYLAYSGATSVNILGYGFSENNPFVNMLFLKITGNVGDTVTITGRRQVLFNYYRLRNNNNIVELNFGDNEDSSLIIDNKLLSSGNVNDVGINQHFIDKIYTYKVSLDYNGNPTIKAGDYIEVESNYGMVPIFIQKHTLKYNGGLSGSIEGVE